MHFVFQLSDWGSVQKLLLDTKTLRQILDEAESLLRVFWRAALPKSEEVQQVRKVFPGVTEKIRFGIVKTRDQNHCITIFFSPRMISFLSINT